ncbi:hypothetical protein CF326_g8021 [Tilletia indica]|nr:hypothetical protein CF326_g8021 [Tilletia indica]
MPKRQARHQAGEQEADITRHLIGLQAGETIETAVPDSCRVPLQPEDCKLFLTAKTIHGHRAAQADV